MSIRSALIGGVSILLLLVIGIVVAIGAAQIRRSVVLEALSRVDHDLSLLAAMYEKEMRLQAERLRFIGEELQDGCTTAADRRVLAATRRRLRLTVLNCVGPDGRRLGLPGADDSDRTPVDRDPVIRRALEGNLAWGTVLLDSDRLLSEGGPSLARSQVVHLPESEAHSGTQDALFRWFAVPLRDAEDKVTGVVYGGRPINHDHALVDEFVDTLFGSELYDGKPLGTVTFFLRGTRVATNVHDATGRRALGTRVSDVVRQHVLDGGKRWKDRAWVVDAWYISGYLPLQDPDGETIGMLYVGLLEAPYDALRTRMILRLALPALILLGVGLAAAALVVNRITRPLAQLRANAGHIESGHWDSPATADRSYSEITELGGALHRMQKAIARRDRELRETNADLERVNANYMSTLGFVTHELKAPLANIQSLVSLVVDGYVGDVPEKARQTLTRIQRNCEELQDMVKNYLDLSRAERDELQPEMRRIDLVADVVTPVVTQADSLFRSRGMALEIDTPESIPLDGDPELLRIALTNYVNNAAKYGREDGRARLSVVVRDGCTVEMWNEGEGFDENEQSALFGKFSRLKNANTRSKKGSGLGLYLTDRIVALHGGRTGAESERGAWARFRFCLPAIVDS